MRPRCQTNIFGGASLMSESFSQSKSPDAMDSTVLKGGCFCGQLAYTSTELPSDVDNCHCVTCRKHHGSAFVTFGNFKEKKLTWTSKSSLVEVRDSSVAIRYRCGACGTFIAMKYHCEPDDIGITMSSIDEQSLKLPLPKPKGNIFVGQKASWYDIPSDQVQCVRFNAEFQEKLDLWMRTQSGGD